MRLTLTPVSATPSPPASEGANGLDCVIVGYNDLPIDRVEAAHRATEARSGAYRNFKANTIWYRGRRRPLMHVLNDTIATTTGRDPQLHVGHLPNLAVAYLKSYLVRRGLTVEIVNFFTAERERLASLLEEGPRAVAITTTFYVDPEPIIDLVQFIRRHSADTKIVVGGPHIFNVCSHGDAITQDYLLHRMGADFYIVDSQGEATLCALLRALRGKSPDLERVANLTYAEGRGFRRTPRSPESNPLDENVIDWSRFDRGAFVPTVQMRTARSCAFKCSFCRYPIVAGALTLTSIGYVEAELRQLAEAGARTVVFVDDTFNVPLPRFKELCRMMIRNRFDVSWYWYFRCSNADDETLNLMKQSGCAGVFLGIESADPGVLTHMRKAASPERYAYGIGRLKANDILTFASLIIGFPGETADSVRRTAEFLENTAPDFYRAELYYHDTNTPIHEQSGAFEITGGGYSWAHATMNWQQACDHIDAMYADIRHSAILPLYMFDFWSIPYVIGRGVSRKTFTAFARAAQGMLVRGLHTDHPEGPEFETQLQDVFRPVEAAFAPPITSIQEPQCDQNRR